MLAAPPHSPAPPKLVARPLGARLDEVVGALGLPRGAAPPAAGCVPLHVARRAAAARLKLTAAETGGLGGVWTRPALLRSVRRDVTALAAEVDGRAELHADVELALPSSIAPGTRIQVLMGGAAVRSAEWVTFLGLDGWGVLVRTHERAVMRPDLFAFLVLDTAVPDAAVAPLARRRALMDRFIHEHPWLRPNRRVAPTRHALLTYVFACPCCGFPTRRPTPIAGRGGILAHRDPSACATCGWSDAEGHDDAEAEAPSAANDPYTLGGARANVAASGTMFDREDDAPLAGLHRTRRVALARQQAAWLFDGLLGRLDDPHDQTTAWQGAFARLDELPAAVHTPRQTCPVPAAPGRRPRTDIVGAVQHAGAALRRAIGGFTM